MVSLAPPSASAAVVEGDIAASQPFHLSVTALYAGDRGCSLWRFSGPQLCAGSTTTPGRWQGQWGGRVSSPAAAGLCEEQSPPVGHLPMEAASKICSGTCCCPDRPLWWEHHSSVQEGTMAQQTSLFLPSFQRPCWPLHLMTSVVRSTEQRDVLTHTQEPP